MSDQGLTEGQIRDDLRRSDRREWQLWVMTLGLLILLGSGALVGFYLVAEEALGPTASRTTAYRLLGALALLTALFCLYILHARVTVGRVKHLLNDINGMATANLELADYLPAIARGMAQVHATRVCRILLLRQTEPALDVSATHLHRPGSSRPADGEVLALERLPVCRQVASAGEPAVLADQDLARLAPDDAERLLLTAGQPRVESVLVVPMRSRTQVVGLIVLGRARRLRRRSWTAAGIATARTLAGHAGTAIEEAIRRRESIRDPLTGLFNRRHFADRMTEEIARAARERHTLAVLLCDLDGFKAVNDLNGHRVGDDVLKAVAICLRDATRGTDLHFRWGGDEMAVVLTRTTTEGALIAADRIGGAVRAYARKAGLALDVSTGIALYPQHGTNEDELIHAADLAMYMAKKSGVKVRVGDEEYALDERCVRFVYQPVVRVASGDVLGYEVLTRDPEGRLTPSELFEKYRAVGQLGKLKQMIFELQLRDAARAGLETLFVNGDLELLGRLTPVPKPEGVTVVIELSEVEGVRDLDTSLAVVRRWRGAGYRFAIDDFASGQTSLPFIARVAPEYVKVDRTALVQAVESARYRGFLESLVRAAGAFAARGIVAEGVERETELAVVRELGIPFAQGYLFGRPRELEAARTAAALVADGPALRDSGSP